jgi:hypothetical protein
MKNLTLEPSHYQKYEPLTDKIMNNEYKSLVFKAKELLKKIECHQAEIAYLATQVVFISHGGKRSSKEYNMTKFAQDIGVERKTLSGWVQIYKNVIEKSGIEVKDITPELWTKASKVETFLRQNNTANNKAIGSQKNKSSMKSISSLVVKDLLNKSYDVIEFQAQFSSWLKYTLFIKNNIQTKDLSHIPINSIISMKENVDNISDSLFRYITKGN